MKKLRIILFSFTTIILILGVSLLLKKNNSENPYSSTRSVSSCGNTDLTTNQKKGKKVFDSNCLACHKLNSKSTGPALHEVDSLVFINWLTNKKHKIDSTKVEILAIDYHKTVFSKTLTKKDVYDLIEYCHSE